MLTPVRQPTDIAVVGPMARSAADLELALGIISGPDGEDAGAWSLALPAPRQSSLKDFRVAVVSDDRFAEVDAPVRAEIEALGEFLSREGPRCRTPGPFRQPLPLHPLHDHAPGRRGRFGPGCGVR